MEKNRARALVLCGEMKGPFRWKIEPQVLAAIGGEGEGSTGRRGRFDAMTGASFEAAESRVECCPTGDGGIRVRLAIEGLDLLGLVTADRIVAELREPGREGSARPSSVQGDEGVGMEIVNLRVLDEPVETAHLSPAGCRIPVADLGTLHLGEVRETAEGRRLTMVRLELTGRLQGELVAGCVEVG
jgi:hypothetical protein